MQQAQQNYRWLTAAILVLLSAAAAAGTVRAAATDPLLAPGKGPCDAQTSDPNYVPETDVNGHPVAPADLAAPRFGNPDAILVPLGKSPSGETKGWATLDRAQLDALLNPRPACSSGKP